MGARFKVHVPAEEGMDRVILVSAALTAKEKGHQPMTFDGRRLLQSDADRCEAEH